jgi:glucose/arabinose dehydrogenase
MRPARNPTMSLVFLAGLALALALGAGCGGGSETDDDTGDSADGGDGGDGGDGADDGADDGGDGAVPDCEPVNGTNLALEPTLDPPAKGQPIPLFDEPLMVTSPPGDPRLFVVEKAGVIKIVKDRQVLGTPFLDIDERVSSGQLDNEQGLLGLAFHPDFASNGRFFVYYTAEDDDVNSQLPANVVSEFHVVSGSPDLADARSERRVLEVADSAPNHNGGMIAFGSDGYLYIGLGDGGGENDPNGNAQNKSTLLGDILRINIDNNDANDYGIPGTNPYAVPQNGERQEIYISGVRNPWRWSFDRQTGDMYIADVGQDTREEVSVLPAGQQAGANLGWATMEADICRTGTCGAELVRPVATYENPTQDSRAVVGGYVYRGSCFPDIQGWYFYGDYITEQVWKFRFAGGTATEHVEVTADIDPNGLLDGLAGFGQDAAGELYAVSIRSGEVFHIVAGP